MRSEVTDYMRACEHLISLAMQTGELSDDECDMVSYYSKELHDKTYPLCTKQYNSTCDTPAIS